MIYLSVLFLVINNLNSPVAKINIKPNESISIPNPSDLPTFTLITTGDIMPGRTVNYVMTENNNFKFPFEKTAQFLQSADLTIINLEAPLVENCPVINEGMIFCGDQRFIEGLLYAGIDVANLANNHSFNYGKEGIEQTSKLLKENGILVAGYPINKLAIKQLNNWRIGILGWNLLDNFEESKILEVITNSLKQVDFLIVSLHWGTEYTRYPNQNQQTLAHKIIEAGADLIVGNHPHWFQGIEKYQSKLIIYSHGNFIFDQEWSQETKIGFVSLLNYAGNNLIKDQYLPIKIKHYGQPEFLQGKEKNEVLKAIEEASQLLNK